MNIPLVHEEVTPRAYNTALLYLKRRIAYLNRTIKLDGIGELMNYAISLATRLEQNLAELQAVLGSDGTINASFRNPVYHPLTMEHSSRVQATLIKNDDLTVSRINNSLVPLNGDLEIFEAEFNIALKDMYSFMNDNYQEIYDISDNSDDSGSAVEVLNMAIQRERDELTRVGYGRDDATRTAVQEAVEEAMAAQEEELEEIQETTEEVYNQPSVEETIEAAQIALDEDEDPSASNQLLAEQLAQATDDALSNWDASKEAVDQANQALIEANNEWHEAQLDVNEIRDSMDFGPDETLGKGETYTADNGVTYTHNADDTWTITTTGGTSFTGPGNGSDVITDNVSRLDDDGPGGHDASTPYGQAIQAEQDAKQARDDRMQDFRDAAQAEYDARQEYTQAAQNELDSAPAATSDELENGWYNPDADDSEPTDYGDFEGWFD